MAIPQQRPTGPEDDDHWARCSGSDRALEPGGPCDGEVKDIAGFGSWPRRYPDASQVIVVDPPRGSVEVDEPTFHQMMARGIVLGDEVGYSLRPTLVAVSQVLTTRMVAVLLSGGGTLVSLLQMLRHLFR